jgi:hypothetical protein
MTTWPALGSGSGISSYRRLSSPSNFSKTIARRAVLLAMGTDYGGRKGVDRGRDLRAIRFQCEVTGVEEPDERTRDIPLKRLGARRSTWERSTLICP